MDTLVGIPISLIKILITTAPFATILIAVALFAYYKFSRVLLKKILGTKTVEEMGDMKASDSAELYNSTVRFAGHAVEFLVVLLILLALSNSVGFLPDETKSSLGQLLDSLGKN